MASNHLQRRLIFALTIILFAGCGPQQRTEENRGTISLHLKQDEEAGTIEVFKEGTDKPVVTQHAKPDFRPYLHPIAAPDGKGELTEYSPGHHKHQTGLYWGFTRVNGSGVPMDTVHKYFYQKEKIPGMEEKIGRDFFHHPEGDHWRRVSFAVLNGDGPSVSWQTVYNMLDKEGNPILVETQTWTMKG